MVPVALRAACGLLALGLAAGHRARRESAVAEASAGEGLHPQRLAVAPLLAASAVSGFAPHPRVPQRAALAGDRAGGALAAASVSEPGEERGLAAGAPDIAPPAVKYQEPYDGPLPGPAIAETPAAEEAAPQPAAAAEPRAPEAAPLAPAAARAPTPRTAVKGARALPADQEKPLDAGKGIMQHITAPPGVEPEGPVKRNITVDQDKFAPPRPGPFTAPVTTWSKMAAAKAQRSLPGKDYTVPGSLAQASPAEW